MRALIRFLRRGQAGSLEQKDREFAGEAVTLGRATDQVLHLKDRRVALAHARIILRGGQSVIVSSAPGGVLVNGGLCREARLQPGDTVQVGANLLRLFVPPAGFDAAFTFELDAAAVAAEAATPEVPKLALAELGWSRRRWSWGLFVAVLLLTLVVPAAGLWSGAVQDDLRRTPLPDDGLWSSGPLASVHQTIGARCETCHVVPFVRVRTGACLTCHGRDVHRHVARATGLGTDLDSTRCATCHAEHNEPATLVRHDEKLCIRCHADLKAAVVAADGAVVGVGNARDFGTAHPEFRVSMLAAPEGGVVERDAYWPTVRVALDESTLREHSNLAFNHRKHLARSGVRSPTGTVVLGCGDCHQPAADGALMQPIRMEQACAGCHTLSFDPAFPGRIVPHGDAKAVLQSLVEYYSLRYLQGFPDPAAAPAAAIARPGITLTAVQRAAALRRAETEARRVARDLFERRACITCHEVLATNDPAEPWKVAPVRLTENWLPGAHFSHARHSTALTACETCHVARESTSAGDVLMPDISTCRQCHGGSATAQEADRDNLSPPTAGAGGTHPVVTSGRMASSCTLCHDFHRGNAGLWAARAQP